MQPQQQQAFAGLHRRLQHTLKQHKLASFTNVLLRDAVTVAWGVKPAALLDFHLPLPVLKQVFQRIRATDAQLLAPLVLLTLTSSTDIDTAVHFMLHRASFLSQSRLHSLIVPLIDISPSSPSPQLLADEAALLVNNQLHSFTSSLSAALDVDPSPTDVTLHAPPSICLPTLCGWLLSYPALYTLPTSSQILPATNCLSNQPLALFALSLHPTALLSGLSSSFASSSGCVMLQSFTVPTELLSEPAVVSAVLAWEKRLGEVCNNEAVGQWVLKLTISKTSVCLPHVSL